MILFSDDLHAESSLKKKIENVTIYLIHHNGNALLSGNQLRFAYINKVKRVIEITLHNQDGIRTGVHLAKLIYAEQHFSKCEKVKYDFGEELNDEIFYILNPGKSPKSHHHHYDSDYKEKMVSRWISQNRPSKTAFARRYGINPSTFSDWVKKWETMFDGCPKLYELDQSVLSYFEESDEHVPYYFSMDLHDQIKDSAQKNGIILTHMETCVLEDLMLKYGQINIDEDTCMYEPHTKEEFISYMQKIAISKRLKGTLPLSVLSDLWEIRNHTLEKLKVNRRI